MLPSYTDILETITALTRTSHAETKACGSGPSPHCADEIDPVTPRFQPHHPDLCADIYADEVALLKIACQSCGREFLVQMSYGPCDAAQVLAMSGHGVIPRLLDETLVMLKDAIGIASDSDSDSDSASASMLDRMHAITLELGARRKLRPQSLADQVTAGVIHYGDPPSVDCCAAGATMNCYDLAIVEFWRRGHVPSGLVTLGEAMDAMGWSRIRELERGLGGVGGVELPAAMTEIT